MRRFTIPGLLAAVLLASCATFPAPLQQVVEATDRAFPGGELTVVTYNVLHGLAGGASERTLERRLSLLIAALADLRPDVVILQEVSLTPARKHGSVAARLRDGLSAATGEPWNLAVSMAHGSPLIGFYEGSAVLSRYGILSARTYPYRAQSLIPPERRIALLVEVRGAPGPIQVVGTHLTSQAGWIRDRQAAELASVLTELRSTKAPIIVGGDFNATPQEPAIRSMIDAGAVDAWSVAGSGPGFTGIDGEVDQADLRPTERIDYLFVLGAGVQSARLFLDGRSSADGGTPLWVSDHVGVMARIQVGAPGR